MAPASSLTPSELTAPPAVDTEPGKWYFCLRCEACQRLWALFPGLGMGNMIPVSPGNLVVICVHCGHTREYAASAMQSFPSSPE
jgi:hypothetical protein